ncbi:hypothetical protein [Streptomyces lavendulae]|uniref:hypothetical protein n=1 Tax=Streptomyces lavendulae TaxID=1914 RepID=UPI003815CF6F
MSTTAPGRDDLVYACFPIEKSEKSPDGHLYVYGKATDGSVDSDEQIVDPGWAATAIRTWLSTGGNVRVQHNPRRDPAGVGVEVGTDADGGTWVKALVVEPVAKLLVETGALRAYSVGISQPEIVRDERARGGRIIGGKLYEISLVDRPANENCGIRLVKAAQDGRAEWVGTVFGDGALLDRLADATRGGTSSGRAPDGGAAERFADLGVPDDLGTLHDLLCAAYDPVAVEACHPQGWRRTPDAARWAEKAFDAAVGAPLEEAALATRLWRDAVTLSGSDAELVAELRREAHVCFKEANAGPGPFPRPGTLVAGRFRRPLIDAGHARSGAGHQGPHTAEVPVRPLEASGLRRGPLTEGHAAPSPGTAAEGDAVVPAPEPAGRPERVDGADALREGTRSAMAALHDHIALSFPGLCPMDEDPHPSAEPPAGARPVPVPRGTPGSGKGADPVTRPPEAAGRTGADVDFQVTGIGDLATGLERLRCEITAELAMITQMLEEVRGLVLRLSAPAGSGSEGPPSTPTAGADKDGSPVAAKAAGPDRSWSDGSERARSLVIRELDQQCRTSADPAQREAAWDALNRLRGLS